MAIGAFDPPVFTHCHKTSVVGGSLGSAGSAGSDRCGNGIPREVGLVLASKDSIYSKISGLILLKIGSFYSHRYSFSLLLVIRNDPPL